jgi:hypothetical protein
MIKIILCKKNTLFFIKLNFSHLKKNLPVKFLNLDIIDRTKKNSRHVAWALIFIIFTRHMELI